MRIAFDGTTLRPGRTGVGYYTEHLLHHLATSAADDELMVVSNRADRHRRGRCRRASHGHGCGVANAAAGLDADARRRGCCDA